MMILVDIYAQYLLSREHITYSLRIWQPAALILFDKLSAHNALHNHQGNNNYIYVLNMQTSSLCTP